MPEKIDTSTILIQLQQGDEAAIRVIFDLYWIDMCRIAKGFVNDDLLAQGIVSDLLCHFWESRESIKTDIDLRSYLFKAVRNSSINYLDKAYVRRECSISGLSDDTLLPSDIYFHCNETPYDVLADKELRIKIKKAVDLLPKECAEVFKLNRYEGLKYTEIADKLGISVNTVKYHLKQAIKRLKTQLKYFIFILFYFIS